MRLYVNDVTNTVSLGVATSRMIAIFDGDAWVTRIPPASAHPEYSLPTTPNAAYDVYAYWTGAEVKLEIIPWPGPNPAEQDGVMVKPGDPTRRYLGTVATHSDGYVKDSPAKRLVWNAYNKQQLPIYNASITGGWSYNGANSVWRPAAGSGASYYVEVVVGRGTSPVSVQAAAMGYPTNVTSAWLATGIGIDQPTVNYAQVGNLAVGYSSPQYAQLSASYVGEIQNYGTVPKHKILWLETGYGNYNFYFLGAATVPAFGKLGLTGTITM